MTRVIRVCDRGDVGDNSEFSGSKAAVTLFAQIPDILQLVDAVRGRGQGNLPQRHRRLMPAKKLDKLPEVDTLRIFDRVRNDVDDLAWVDGVANLASFPVTQVAVAAHLLRPVGGLERCSVELEPFVGASGSHHGLRKAAATESRECSKPFLDGVDDVFDIKV